MLAENQKLQKGIYSFLNKKGIAMSGMRYVLVQYALTRELKKPKKKTLEWYATISNLAQQDFAAFKKVYNKCKGNVKHYQTYDDWWDECNTDGSFAYSGVTEDF
jgi:hypothetical protein